MILCCPLQVGVCMCEEGFTEVLSPSGQLEQCAPIPILEIPTGGKRNGDVKTSRAINPTLPTSTLPGRPGRTWYLQPYRPGLIIPHVHCVYHFSYSKYKRHRVLLSSKNPFNVLTVTVAVALMS